MLDGAREREIHFVQKPFTRDPLLRSSPSRSRRGCARASPAPRRSTPPGGGGRRCAGARDVEPEPAFDRVLDGAVERVDLVRASASGNAKRRCGSASGAVMREHAVRERELPGLARQRPWPLARRRSEVQLDVAEQPALIAQPISAPSSARGYGPRRGAARRRAAGPGRGADAERTSRRQASRPRPCARADRPGRRGGRLRRRVAAQGGRSRSSPRTRASSRGSRAATSPARCSRKPSSSSTSR